jgi:hypothetical protein
MNGKRYVAVTVHYCLLIETIDMAVIVQFFYESRVQKSLGVS